MKSKTGRFALLCRKYLAIFIVCIVALIICALLGDDRYYQRMLLLVLIWASARCSFNIISGYGGQIVFGYMMFLGAGAYTTVLLFRLLGVTPWIGMAIGSLVSAFIALMIGLPTLRLRGAYFAVATVAFPLITIPIVNNAGFEEVSIPFTRAFSAMQFADIRAYVIIAAIFLVVVMIIVRMIETSRFGFALKALKENQTAAEGMGIDTFKMKMLAFILSAALAAIVGTIYAFGIQYMISTQSMFGLFIIVRILSISIVGGLATLWGPLVGATVLVPLGELLDAQIGDAYPGAQDIVYGAFLIAAIIYIPEGIWGKWLSLKDRFSKKPGMEALQAAGTEESDLERRFVLGPLNLEFLSPEGLKGNGDGSILKVETVSKSFGGIMPLVNVNIDVTKGKILGIIGPNGAGKTTLFNVINGYLTPENGAIQFDGHDITRSKPHTVCRLGIGRTFQIPQILSHMTILENIMIGAFGKGMSVEEAAAISTRIAEQLGISLDRLNEKAVGLSSMEIKMMELSRALATRPSLLLVDEPMSGLNLEEAGQIGEVTQALARCGITVIIIEHFVQSLMKVADWMVGLDAGKIVAEGTPEKVTSNPHMIEAYLGSKWKERYAKS
ncbi:MAG: branched-chain amino acid ABC transporter ATP-binding protein/permease [Pseudomonadota bacterium]